MASFPEDGLTVIVCGGRDFQNYDCVCRVLDSLPIKLIVHGGYRGADRLAHRYAKEHNVKEVECKAQWGRYGTQAGPIRNAHMLKFHPDLVVAFPGNAGTADMVNRARNAGVNILEVQELAL